MTSGALLGSPLYVYLTYCLEFGLRYFALAGGAYWLLHVAFRGRFLTYRIQEKFPESTEIRHEIRWSMSNMCCTGFSTVLTYELTHNGYSNLYYGVLDHGVLWLALSAVLCVVGYDTWLYWEHRLLHTDWLFQHAHRVHHRVGNPTPLATFAHHPIETLMGNVYFVLFAVLVPVHPLALAAAGLYMFLFGIVGHLGYEFYPRWFSRTVLFKILNTATYHNIHHRQVRCNYGAYFIFWDHWMGTANPSYEETFDVVTARRSDATLTAL